VNIDFIHGQKALSFTAVSNAFHRVEQTRFERPDGAMDGDASSTNRCR
jgi:hypothetical protein